MVKIQTVPPGFRIKQVMINGTSTSMFVQKTSRRKRAVSKATKVARKLAAKKFTIPAVTAVVTAPMWVPAVFELQRQGFTESGVKEFINNFTGPLFAVQFGTDWRPFFKPRELLRGLPTHALITLGLGVGLKRRLGPKLKKASGGLLSAT